MKKQFLLIAAICAAMIAGGNVLAGPPSFSLSFNNGYGGSGWSSTDLTGTFTCSPIDPSTSCTINYCTDITNTCTPAPGGASPQVVNFTTEGTTYLRYCALDNNGSSTCASGVIPNAVINIDKNVPTGVLLSAPAAGATLSGVVNLTAAGTDTGSGISKFEFYYVGAGSNVKIGEGNPTYSWNTSGVANGSYMIFTRAIDNSGKTADSAPISITISNISPLTITESQAIPALTNSMTYAYAFTANATGTFTVGGIDCVALSGSFLSGANNVTITLASNTAQGAKTCIISFASANGSTTKTDSFTFDSVAPSEVTLSNKPANPTESTSLNITVGGADVTYYKYYIDNGGYSADLPIGQVLTASNLAAGQHTLYVAGRDAAGNWQSSPTTYTWSVNPGSAPTAEISGMPSDPTSDTSINITVSGTNVTHYKYKLDSGSYGSETPVATKISLTGLAKGELHRLYVLGKSSGGVWQTTPTEYEWEINRTATTQTDDTVNRYQFTKDLEQGDSSADIIALHNILKKEGFYRGSITNFFSADTAKALKEYQAENRLTQSGMLDLKTRNYLNANAPAVTAQGGTIGAVVSTVNKVKGYIFPTTIWFGKAGNDVKELQKRLIFEKFYTGPITGILDVATKTAMKAYQLKYKLDDTGILDDITMRFMNANVPYYDAGPFKFTAILKLNAKGEDVKQLQQILYKEKFYRYLPNSVLTASTQAALKLFQAKYKLAVTGIVDAATMVKLNAILGVSATGTTTKPAVSTPSVAGYKFSVLRAFGAKGDDVAMLQKFLYKAGFYKWAASGTFTTGVESALSAFQKKYNLPTSGELDKATMDKINSLFDSIMGSVKSATTTPATVVPASSLPSDKAQLEAMYKAIKALLGK